MTTDNLLPKVKANLILSHDADDELLLHYIKAAVAYAESYQHVPEGYYSEHTMPPTTEQAVIMLSSHLYGTARQPAFLPTMCKLDSRYGTL
jgi:hypothetical protein